jgi:integrase
MARLERPANGKGWRFRLPTQPDGRRPYHPVLVVGQDYDGTEADAKRYMHAFLGKPAEQRVIPIKKKFLPYAEEVIASFEGKMEEKTRKGALADIKRHAKPLHHRYVSSITAEDIAGFIAGMERQGYAGATIKNVLFPLNRIFRRAVRAGLLKENPISLLERGERPKCAGRRRVPILLETEITVLLNAAVDHGKGQSCHAAMFSLALFAGLRKGEIRHLTWGDIDFDNMTIRVVKGKTKNAERKAQMSAGLSQILARHSLEAGESNSLDFVFPGRTTGAPLGDTGVQKIVTAVVLRSGLWTGPEDPRPKPTLHTLRHNYGSALVAQGLDIKFVSSQIGHASAAFTLAVYVHEVEEQRNRGVAADAIDAHWGTNLLG